MTLPTRVRSRGLLLAAVQVGVLIAVAGWMRIEEAIQPRGWVRTAPVDPDLPIRGRYVAFSLQVPAPALPANAHRVILRVRDGRVVAAPVGPHDGNPQNALLTTGPQGPFAQLVQPLAFFLPEHGADPSQRGPGETLWAEVTLPRQGPPRPLRLGVERQPGRIEPLSP
ncbi:MAG: hypothetical protein ACK6BG_01955 [Cyanobacteriota bacterium]